MSDLSKTGMPVAATEASATVDAIPEHLEEGIEARPFDSCSNISGSGAERPRETDGSLPDSRSDPGSDSNVSGSDAGRPRGTNGSLSDNYSDPDSDLDIMNDAARMSDASLIEGMGTHGRPSMTTGGLHHSASSASFATCTSQYSHYSQYGPGSCFPPGNPSCIKKLGRVGTVSTAGSARCSWAQSVQSYQRGYAESGYGGSEISHYSFPDSEDYEDLSGERASYSAPVTDSPVVAGAHYSFPDSEDYEDLCGERASYSAPVTDSPVVAGAASILKGRTPDGSLPGNPSSDGRSRAAAARAEGAIESLGHYSRAWGGPSSSAWDPPYGGSLGQGRPFHGPTPPVRAQAAASHWGEEVPAAASRLAASYVEGLTEATRASLCESDAGRDTPVRAQAAAGYWGEEVPAAASRLAASYVEGLTEATRASLCESDAGCDTPVGLSSGAAGSSSGPSSGTCPPKPPKEGTSKSSAYIRKRRAAGGASSGHS